MTPLPVHHPQLSPFRFREEPCTTVPLRSTLPALPPFGLGTRNREGLSSYLMRLADIHGITPQILVRELMWPRLGYTRAAEADCYWQKASFDTIGRVPRMWSQTLSDLTSVKGLHRLSLLPLQGLVPFRHLAPTHQRWCPLCVQEDYKANEPYGHLIWNIAVVEACSKHGIRLVSLCNCSDGERIQHGHRKYLPYLCFKCGRILGSKQSPNLITATSGEMRRANLIGELLESDLFEGEQLVLRPAMVSLFLQDEVEKLGNAAFLARHIGTRKSCIHYWKQGRHLPSLPWVVRIAEKCSASIHEVLIGKERLEPREWDQRNSVQTCKWTGSPDKRAKAFEKLNSAMHTNPPVKLSVICQELESDPRVVRMMHPDLVKTVVSRWAEWSRRETLMRRQKVASLIWATAEEFAARGIRPTSNIVTNSLRGKMTIFSSEAKAVCKEICKLVAKNFGLGSPS